MAPIVARTREGRGSASAQPFEILNWFK